MSETKKTRKKRFDAVHKSIPGLDETDVLTSGGLSAEDEHRLKEALLTPENSTIAHRKVGAICARCGGTINDSNGVITPKTLYQSGYHPICLFCQQKHYADIAQATSRTYALFYACIAYGLPYKPSVIEGMIANQNGVWYEYVKKLQSAYFNQSDLKIEVWTDGITDIAEAFSGEFPVLPITGDVMVSNMSELPNEKRWGLEWGEGWTPEDYKLMDSRYMMLASEYKGAPIPPRVDMNLHDIVKFMLLRDQSMKSDSMTAKRYQEMIDKIMSSEDLRARDSRQSEVIKIDKLVERLEAGGAIKNHSLLSHDELIEWLRNQHGGYQTSIDVVDEMIFCIANATRRNSGLSELDRLPRDAQVKDFHGELLPKMTDTEKDVMRYLGATPPERE